MKGRRLALLAVYIVASTGCVYHIDDHDVTRSANTEAPKYGSLCRYSADGDYGSCRVANQDIVGMPCTCTSPNGQQNGTISR